MDNGERRQDRRGADGPLLDGGALTAGEHELEFPLGDDFSDRAPIRVGIDDADAHFHVLLLAGPWSYSTYRGS